MHVRLFSHLFLLFAFCLVWPARAVSNEGLREWTDIEGRRIDAVPLDKTEDAVRVRRSDGGVFTIFISRLSEEDRKWIREWEPQETPSAAIEDAVVLIETPRSRGSGFLASYSDGVFVVTNQHVIEGVLPQQISVTSLRGERLHLQGLEVCPQQDLARLPVQAPAGLRINYSTAHEAEVIAYGNSRGSGVATTSRGTVVGVSHDTLEVTAEIVQGNSGGPVVDSDGCVIGVASFVTIEHQNSKDWVTRGTRYENPRRFAIRLREDQEWRKVDWGQYATETRRIGDVEAFLDHAIQLASAIIANPTQQLAQQEAYADSLQGIVRSHNQHVRRFDAKIGREVSNHAEVRRANQSQNAAYRARLRRVSEVLFAEVSALRSGRPTPLTPYLAQRVARLDASVAQVNSSLEEIMKVERSFYVISSGR